MATERREHTLKITVDNIRPSDAIGLIKMFKHMERLGKWGSSRWCSFYADGDGAFRPKVSFEYPIELPEVPEITGTDDHGTFSLDSDEIAWKIYHDPDEFVQKDTKDDNGILPKK